MIKVTVKYDKDIEMWVSHLPSFDLYSQGYTKRMAVNNLADALHGFVTVGYVNGMLVKCFDVTEVDTDG